MSRHRFCIALIVLASVPVFLARAGDLNPPPGPIAPTDRVTISDADPLPIVISAPGSYVLTSNLGATPGGVTIDIQSSNVTLDLNGFTLDVFGGTDGISIGSSRSSVTIRNGVIINAQRGIVSAGGGKGLMIERVDVRDGTSHGFQVEAATLRACNSINNLGDGFRAIGDSVVIDSRAWGNGLIGINVSGGGLVSRCVSTSNGNIGIFVTLGGIVRDSIAKSNRIGINASGGSSVIGCVASDNQADGFELRDASLVESCQARGNGLSGVGSGFRLSGGSRAVECVSTSNTDHGFRVGSKCVVDRNAAFSNNGVGVFVIGVDNRIVANQLRDNATTNLDSSAAGGGNLIMQNTANGGYNIGPLDSASPVSGIGAAGPLDNIAY